MIKLRDKLYQMFILGTEGGGYKKALQLGLGGIIFFTNDIQSIDQFKTLIKKIKENSLIPPFLSIDQEGGRVERTENIHHGKKYLSAKYAFEKGTDYLSNQTQEIAEELNDFGINLNFAPCIDTNTNPNNPIIGERAFSSEPDEVIIGEKIVSNIYKNNRIIPCIKHFPGHGDTNTDSHLTLPEIKMPLDEMEKTHIKPFKAAIENGADLIMIAHMHCECFDKETIPTSLSKNTIDYLRNTLNYNGVIISDDMIMKGVRSFGETQAAIMAINAGINMLIYRNSDQNIINIIENIYQKAIIDKELQNKINISYEKIIKLKTKYLILNQGVELDAIK